MTFLRPIAGRPRAFRGVLRLAAGPVSGHRRIPVIPMSQQGAETVLTGLLPDAAALYGVLGAIEALGLDLLEVRKIRPRRHEWPGSG
jgi:hypothetical protein